MLQFSPTRIRLHPRSPTLEMLSVLLSHLGFRLPSQLGPSLMLPLDLNQGHLFVPQNLHIPIQDHNQPLNIIPARIHLNVL